MHGGSCASSGAMFWVKTNAKRSVNRNQSLSIAGDARNTGCFMLEANSRHRVSTKFKSRGMVEGTVNNFYKKWAIGLFHEAEKEEETEAVRCTLTKLVKISRLIDTNYVVYY